MARMKIKCVQLIQRNEKGITSIGVPVERAFGIEVVRKMFLNHPSIIAYPSVCLEDMNINLKKSLKVV